MDETDKRRILRQQETIDSEYRHTRQVVEELFETVDVERRRSDNDLENLYQRHDYAIKQIDEDYSDNQAFRSELESAKDAIENTVKQTRIAIDDCLMDYEADYRKTQNVLSEKLLEK
ncbi:hypothetical protein [Latilactobacillus graminis]|uniref:Uncharacterized protein n=2 Tax=Latilactobacillus graminis TaxID=60519 RepID=A0AA89L0Q0_9LACO|nr:hypothetical protein [Latilactobacillus graminis]KRM23604.1 hypothetical protein FC90_GL000068 [Latilactobacillus graminis DSM 20719]QFP80202.1 hypothetical protein LG542_08245 [Latilactobacillus graminis]